MDVTIRNRLRALEPVICGTGHPTLLLGSIGTSRDSDGVDLEFKKAGIIQEYGADAVTDHSFYGDLDRLHRSLAERLDILVSTIACYEFSSLRQEMSKPRQLDPDPVDVFQMQANRGVDLITVHAALLREHLDAVRSSNRRIPMSSKGGGIIAQYMNAHSAENPYYEHFDEILEICKEYHVTLSLGTALRPATVCDGWDSLIDSELRVMAELVGRAVSQGVGIMIEGIGHAVISAIPTYVFLAKARCLDVPYRVLPMATDVALGLDHISGAIATAVSVASGANAITCITRSEHVGLPSVDDIREGIATARIAIHCGEISRLGGSLLQDEAISSLRQTTGCRSDWRLALCPKHARAELTKHGRLTSDEIQCGMCGDHCAIRASLCALRREES